MFKSILAVLWLLPTGLFAADTTGIGLDVGTLLVAYGAATPFAIICFIQMNRAQSRADAKEQENTQLREAMLAREKEYVSRFAPLMYDSALLYKQGNEAVAKAIDPVPNTDQKIDKLLSTVEQLTKHIAEGPDA